MTSCHHGTVLRQQLEEYEVGVRWPPACEDVSPGAEECWKLLLSNMTENTSHCVIVICKYIYICV
jgi:hypothetical protein